MKTYGSGMGWEAGGRDTSVFLPGESPWTEEPGGLQSASLLQRVGHNCSNLAYMHMCVELSCIAYRNIY